MVTPPTRSLSLGLVADADAEGFLLGKHSAFKDAVVACVGSLRGAIELIPGVLPWVPGCQRLMRTSRFLEFTVGSVFQVSNALSGWLISRLMDVEGIVFNRRRRRL